LSSTKPGHRVKAAEAARAARPADAAEAAPAVVAAVVEVLAVVGEAAVEEIAAGNTFQPNLMKFMTGEPSWLPGFHFELRVPRK
jgi:hypothetical protein